MMERTHYIYSAPQRQQGIALFLSLVMLLILTLLGISSVQTTTLEQRMARNARDSNMAFHGAETAVSDAEVFIDAQADMSLFPGTQDDLENTLGGAGLHTALGGAEYWQCGLATCVNGTDLSYMDEDTGNFRSAGTVIGGLADEPKYVVEYVKRVIIEEDTLNIGNIGEQLGSGTAYVFRITARGTGATAQSHVVVQTLYGRQF